MSTIRTKGLYYKTLNRRIRELLSQGAKNIVLLDVLGQRYIGGGLNGDATFHIYGTPGQDLGTFLNGPHLFVYGNVQDGVGNTMNDGKIVIHGKAGEIPGHSMRGGKIYIRDDVEYRAAIHMKEYLDKIPWLVIGGTAKDYCGEYMAGGRVVVLNLKDIKTSPVGKSLGTGIHGGRLFIRGNVKKHQLGAGAVFGDMDENDSIFLSQLLQDFSKDMNMSLSGIGINEFVKITKKGHRPFGELYTPGINIKTQWPEHRNLTPPCMFNCPTGIPTPVFLNLIKAGKIQEAQLLIDEYTLFRVSVCGNACPAPCMEACNRNMIDGAVQLKTLAAQFSPTHRPKISKKKQEEHIAIIGAGPAGLSAAWQLSRRGYPVTVYDSAEDLGGKVKRAIPRSRLTEKAINTDIKRITSLPITFNLGKPVSKELFRKIYDTNDIVIVATGSYKTKRIFYDGGNRIESGLQFLIDINNGKPMDLSNKEVVIIGSGNVGMDIACESWRLGAKKVTAIDIQKPLAYGNELNMAQELGTQVLWPKYIKKLDKKSICFEGGSTLKADVVFFSIGELPDTSFLPESVLLGENGYIITSDKSFKSSNDKIYSCGDIIKPGLITDAVGSGRLAAIEIHATLRKTEFIDPEKKLVPRRKIQTLFFGNEKEEIDRCMSCATCIFCDACIEKCPQKALSRNGEIFFIDKDKCTRCYTCVNTCPRGAIQIN